MILAQTIVHDLTGLDALCGLGQAVSWRITLILTGVGAWSSGSAADQDRGRPNALVVTTPSWNRPGGLSDACTRPRPGELILL